MSSRKVLIGSTVLVAVLLVVALAGFTRAQTRLKGYPERESVAAGLADRFAAVRDGAESARAQGVDRTRCAGARENLGQAVTGFDQALAGAGPRWRRAGRLPNCRRWPTTRRRRASRRP